MNEARKRHEIRSSNRTNKDIRKIERAKSIIEDLERHGPAGLIHVAILSNIIGKPIKIWNTNNGINTIIGKEKIGPAINIEYRANGFRGIGHWTLMQDKDPDDVDIDLNSCLFSVIGSQTGMNPLKLRRWTMLRLKRNFRHLADRLDDIFPLERNYNDIILMTGGARYCGSHAADAAIILDRSQDALSYGNPILGHPRGHALYSEATGNTDNVERYSAYMNSWKTGFLTRNAQNYVAHLILKSTLAQEAMHRLNTHNKRERREAVELKISSSTLFNSNKRKKKIPKVAEFKGKMSRKRCEPEAFIMILRHHEKHFNEPDADVFVYTFYPILPR